MNDKKQDPCQATPATFELYSIKRDYSLYEVACLLAGWDPGCIFKELWDRDSRFLGPGTLGNMTAQSRADLIFQPWKMDASFNAIWTRLAFALGGNDPLKTLGKREWATILDLAKIPIPAWLLDTDQSQEPIAAEKREVVKAGVAWRKANPGKSRADLKNALDAQFNTEVIPAWIDCIMRQTPDVPKNKGGKTAPP